MSAYVYVGSTMESAERLECEILRYSPDGGQWVTVRLLQPSREFGWIGAGYTGEWPSGRVFAAEPVLFPAGVAYNQINTVS